MNSKFSLKDFFHFSHIHILHTYIMTEVFYRFYEPLASQFYKGLSLYSLSQEENDGALDNWSTIQFVETALITDTLIDIHLFRSHEMFLIYFPMLSFHFLQLQVCCIFCSYFNDQCFPCTWALTIYSSQYVINVHKHGVISFFLFPVDFILISYNITL